MKEATITVQKVSDVLGILGDVWLKAKMFDVGLKNAGHISGTKIVTFIMNQGSNMDASLKAMKALIASCTELFPVMEGHWQARWCYFCHVAPLAPPLAPGFQPDSPLATPRADVAETRDHTNAHDVQVAPPLSPFLATNRADHNERRKKKKKKKAKLKKMKDRK